MTSVEALRQEVLQALAKAVRETNDTWEKDKKLNYSEVAANLARVLVALQDPPIQGYAPTRGEDLR